MKVLARSFVRFASVFLPCIALFLSNGRLVSSGDNLGTRAQAISIGTAGSLELRTALGTEKRNYSFVAIDGKLLNSYPLGTGFLAAPIYSVASLVTDLSASDLYNSPRLEKISAAFLAALSVAVFFLAASKRYGQRNALAAAGLLAFGTPVLTTMGQGLWSQTGELLALSFAYWASSRHERRAFPELAGFSMAFAFLCRPTALLLVALPLLELSNAKKALRFLMATAVGCLGVVALHFALYGRALGGYGFLNARAGDLDPGRIASNLPAVLLSPSKGLFWFFPVLVFCLAYSFRRAAQRSTRTESVVLASTVGLVVLLTSSTARWWGGHSVGPRLLAELSIPCVLAYLSFLAAAPSRRMRIVTGLLAAGQVAAFLVLNFSIRAEQWSHEVAVDANPKVLCSFRNSQLWSVLQPGWKYEEHGPYFDAGAVSAAAAGFAWSPLELSAVANARYDLPLRKSDGESQGEVVFLPRLRAQPPPPSSHFQILPPGRSNVLRVCRGEVSPRIDALGAKVKELDTLMLWRGRFGDPGDDRIAGHLVLEFGNGKTNVRPLRFGQEIVLRRELDLRKTYLFSRFYGGSISAPDGLQRQRFSILGKNRTLRSLRLEAPAEGPSGCLFLFSVSLGSQRTRSAPPT